VLVIDQFEQVFRVASGQDGAAAARERAAFITALHAAATTPCGPGEAPAALVVIAVRGDFTDRCANYPVLAAALQDSQFVVGPMTGADLRLAITGPAAAAGLDIEAGLAETILSELRSAAGGYDAGALPLVSQIMLAVWDHREGRRLTLRGYAQTDGVTDAVASSADAAYASLAASARGLVRQVFRQLVDVSPTGHLARHTAALAELYDPGGSEQRRADDFDRRGADGGDRTGDIDQILDAFARRRLIVIDAFGEGGNRLRPVEELGDDDILSNKSGGVDGTTTTLRFSIELHAEGDYHFPLNPGQTYEFIFGESKDGDSPLSTFPGPTRPQAFQVIL